MAGGGTGGRAGAAPAKPNGGGGGGDDDGDDDISPDSVRAAEQLLLSRSPEVRCFMYDAMTASLFHSNYDLRTVEAARRRTFWIGANVFGISSDELTLLWRVVEAELLLKKEKIKVLGQPWSELMSVACCVSSRAAHTSKKKKRIPTIPFTTNAMKMPIRKERNANYFFFFMCFTASVGTFFSRLCRCTDAS